MDNLDSVTKNHQTLMLFDGECNMCNGFVNFIIDREPAGKISFASMQSPIGNALLVKNKFISTSGTIPDTMVFIDNGNVYTRSTAALHIMSYFGGLWLVLFVLGMLIPWFIRDIVYNIVSANRHWLMKTKNRCRMMTKDVKRRFPEYSPEYSIIS